MVTINETGRDEPPAIIANPADEDDVHDGWGPIRPRRSSMPPDLPYEEEGDTIPLICLPQRDGETQDRED
jgi:hypothetical protein